MMAVSPSRFPGRLGKIWGKLLTYIAITLPRKESADGSFGTVENGGMNVGCRYIGQGHHFSVVPEEDQVR
jgi:hypothetical protein